MLYTARAYAKTNLFLDVLKKRDDGYHDINSVMQALSLYDEVSLRLTNSGIVINCNDELLAGEDNIAFLACKSYFDFANIDCGAEVSIIKNIPVAAGLGGGSADAAAVLLLLNIATKKNYPVSELIPIAAKLGADVPFFLLGGTVKASGIGEVLSKLPNVTLSLVLLKQYEKQSTGAMYNKLDSLSNPAHGDINEFVKKLNSSNPKEISERIFNSFETCWDMDKLSNPFYEFSPLKVFLSGSGPTVCAVFENFDEATACADKLKNRGLDAYAVKTVPYGVKVV